MLSQTIKDVFFNYHNEYEREQVEKKAVEFLEQYPAFKYHISLDELIQDTLNRV